MSSVAFTIRPAKRLSLAAGSRLHLLMTSMETEGIIEILPTIDGAVTRGAFETVSAVCDLILTAKFVESLITFAVYEDCPIVIKSGDTELELSQAVPPDELESRAVALARASAIEHKRE